MARFPRTLADHLVATSEVARSSRTYSIKQESETAQRVEDEAAERAAELTVLGADLVANQEALDQLNQDLTTGLADKDAALAQLAADLETLDGIQGDALGAIQTLQTDLSAAQSQVNSVAGDLDAAELALANANNRIDTVTTSVNGKNKNYGGTTKPAGTAYVVGDKWFKEPGFSIHTWNGSDWIATSDTAIATAKSAADTAASAAATADGKAVAAQTAANNAQTTANTAKGIGEAAQTAADTADGKAVAAQTKADQAKTAADNAQTSANNAATAAQNADTKAANAATAASNAATAASNAQTSANNAASAASTADGKAVAAQTAANNAASAASQAQTDATNAGSAATIAQELANTADGKAVTAQNAANSKSKVTYSTSSPGTAANSVGDTWRQYAAGTNNVIGEWQGTGGTGWQQRKMDGNTLTALDAGTITAGFLDVANRISANSIMANKVVIGAGSDLMYNGSAQNGATTGWSGFTPEYSIVPPNYASCWKTSNTQVTTNFANNPAIQIKPNTQYRLTMWLKADKAGSRFYVEPYSGSSTAEYRSNPIYAFSGMAAPTEWGAAPFTATFTTGSNPANILYFRLFQNHSSGTVFDATYYLTAQLHEMNGGKLIVDGDIVASHIAADAITAAKIKAGEITANKLVTGTLTSASGVFGTIDANILNAGTINAARFNAGDIRAKFIEAGKITAADITAGSLTSASGVFGTIDASIINAGTLNAARLNAGDIRAKFIEAGKITAADIVTGTLTSASGVFGTIDASVINAGTLNTARLNAGDVRAAIITAGKINASEIVAGTLTSASGVFGTVDASVINAGTINAARLNAGDIRAKFLAAGKITAEDIVAGSLTSASGAIGALDAGSISTGTLDAARIATGSLTAKHVMIGDQTNLLNDGSFTAPEATTPWTLMSNGRIYVDATRSSTNVLRSLASDRAAQAIAEQRNVMVKGGDKIIVKASIYNGWTIAATNDVRVTLWFKDKAGGSMGSTSILNLAVGTTAGWTDYTSVVYTVPAGTDQMWVQCNAATTYGGNVMWDDIEVRRLTGATLIEDGAITTNKIVTDAITAVKIATGAIVADKIAAGAIVTEKLAAGAITASKIAISDLTDLAPSYVESPDDWTLDAGVTNIVTTIATAVDKRRFRCIDNTGAAKLARGPYFAAKPGDELYAEGQLYRTGATTNAINLRYYFYDKDKAYMSSSSLTLDGATTPQNSPNAFVQKIMAVAPAGTVYTRLCVVFTNADNSDIGMYNVTGRRRSAGELLVDGAVTARTVAADAITANSIAADAVTATKILAGAIGTNHMTANTINGDRVTANTLHGDKIVANTITAGKIGANQVTAAKLEANLVLGTKIIAGNPTGTRAEMTSGGFRAYAADGAGGSSEVVRLGTDTDDYFAIVKQDGTLAATINQSGGIGAPSANISDSLVYRGREMSTWMDKSPRGIVAWAQFSGSQLPTVNNGSELGLFELAWVPDSSRMYAVHVTPLLFTPSAGMSLSLIARYTTNGSVPTVNSAILARDIKLSHAGNLTISVGMHDRLIGGFNGSHIRVLFTIAAAAGGNAVPFGAQDPTAWVEDIGPAFPQNGVITTGGGVNVNPVATYEKYYTALSVRNFDGAGNLYTNGNHTTMYQGTSPGTGYGKLKSMAFFQDMTGDLSGATINDIQVYFHFNHWYNNAGGTAAIGVHGHTGSPPTAFGWAGGGQTMASAGWPKPGGRWVSMPSAYWNAFKTGAYRGLVLGGGTYDNGTYEYYGIAAANPQIYVRYTK